MIGLTVKLQKNALKTAVIATLSSACALSAFAGSIVQKPGSQLYPSPEFGRALARSGNYTVVAAMQETVVLPGEAISPNNSMASQGTVYLFNGTSNTAERIYQFPGNINYFMQAGGKVAISDKWMAFAAPNSSEANSTAPAAVYIVGKTNGVWAQCPTVNNIVNCTSVVSTNGVLPVKPLIKIPFDQKLFYTDISIAISDNYLVMADSKNSKFTIYRYDSNTTKWIDEFSLDEPNDKFTGKAVAIDGNRVAISSTFTNNGSEPGIEKGMVRIYQRNSSTNTWSAVTSTAGHFTEGNFGRALDMSAGNLVVTAGLINGPQQVAFYRFDNNGYLMAPNYFTTSTAVDKISLSGDTFAMYSGFEDHGVDIYKRDTTASNKWDFYGYMHKNLYSTSGPNPSYPGGDDIDLAGDNLVIGWRGYASTLGAFVHDKVSLIDFCKNPKNLVTNCSFDNSSGNGWQFLNHQGASASVSYSGSQLKATIYNPGSDKWHVQARKTLSFPIAQTYYLEFRARSDSFRQFQVSIGHNGSQDNNWQTYGNYTVSTVNEWTQYYYVFTGTPADANAVLDFNFGNGGTTGVTIDGVSVYPATP